MSSIEFEDESVINLAKTEDLAGNAKEEKLEQ